MRDPADRWLRIVFTALALGSPACWAASPSITTLSPNSATAGGPAFTLTVYGTNFTRSSTVLWDGQPIATSYVSPTALTAAIPSSDISSIASHTVTVTNATGGIDAGVYIQGQRFRIINNSFHDVVDGWHLQTGTGFSGSIVNNTLAGAAGVGGNQTGALVLSNGNSDIRVRNNIFYNAVTDAIHVSQSAMSGICDVSNNIYYSTSGAVGLVDGTPAGLCTFNGNLQVDPGFNGNPANDISLSSTSAARAAGMPSSTVDTDLFGSSRPFSGGNTIGAYQGGTLPGFQTSWQSFNVSDGSHQLTVVGFDGSGNSSTSTAVSLTVHNATPTISNVQVTAYQSSATVTWSTDEPARSRVHYGQTTIYSNVRYDNAFVSTHSVLIDGLFAGALYHYQVIAEDEGGGLGSTLDTTFTAASGGACMTSAGNWQNASFSSQISSFTVSFDATPSANSIDGVVGFSNGPGTAFTSLGPIVRFNQSGTIDARYSSGYSAMTSVPYTSSKTYHFDLRINVPAHLYHVYVTTPGGVSQQIAQDFTFRQELDAVTMLNNEGVLADLGNITACNLVVAPSTVPYTWDGIRELYGTAGGSKTWYSSWDNGVSRSFGYAVDPADPWFDAAHGDASYSVNGSGFLEISGAVPRMYIHHPALTRQTYPPIYGSTGTANTATGEWYPFEWHNVEITFYGYRIADGNVPYAGMTVVARANHGSTYPEQIDNVGTCDSRGSGARIRYDGHVDLEKETQHPNSTSVLNYAYFSGGMPYSTWIGSKLVVYDLSDGSVKYEHYIDTTAGVNGGSWHLLNSTVDAGGWWGNPSYNCAVGVDARLQLNNKDSRAGSESHIPNSAIYFRSDQVGTTNTPYGLFYMKASIREIDPTTGPNGVSRADPVRPVDGGPQYALDRRRRGQGSQSASARSLFDLMSALSDTGPAPVAAAARMSSMALPLSQ